MIPRYEVFQPKKCFHSMQLVIRVGFQLVPVRDVDPVPWEIVQPQGKIAVIHSRLDPIVLGVNLTHCFVDYQLLDRR